jgi:nucleoside-diphosphate-sugar epimerase
MIVVTGSKGRVGRAIADELDAAGYEWQGVDIVATPQFTPSGRFAHRRIDLTSYGGTIEAMTGASAIIHCAAVAYPDFQPEHRTFIDNAAINYNFFAAAVALGIPKVVWLSSEKVYGYPFARRRPAFFPINEDHPLQAEGAYGVSKQISETLAEHMAREGSTTFIGLRSTLVQDAGDYPAYSSFEADPAVRIWALWSYIDSRDLAIACRLAVESDLKGAHSFSVAAEESGIAIPSLELARRYFPEVETRWPDDAGPFASFCDSRRVKEAIGFRSRYRWRDATAPGGNES